MKSTANPVCRVTTTAVLAGAALLVGAPAYARVAPDETTATGPSPTQPASATAEIGNQGTTAESSAPVVRVNVQRMARAMNDPQPAKSTSNRSDPRDPSSVPVTVLALFGGSLAVVGAGFTVYRFRHHDPIGAATA